jgi:uncharacterized lipoprotein YmbA
LFVDIERFEIDADGQCVLTARWRIVKSDDKIEAAEVQGTFVETASPNTDAGVALAMSAATNGLADQIALTILQAWADR